MKWSDHFIIKWSDHFISAKSNSAAALQLERMIFIITQRIKLKTSEIGTLIGLKEETPKTHP